MYKGGKKKKGGKRGGGNNSTNNSNIASPRTPRKEFNVKKGPVTAKCDPVGVPEGSIYQLLREVLGPAFMSFRGDGLNSGLSMPCWMYEPISILQRSAEMFEYAELLEKAAWCTDSFNRMAFVTAFIVSIYSSTPNRFKINFNPILGETFEYVDTRFDDNIKYFSEQVSHHPPRTATHASNSKWVFLQNYHPTTAFLGNNVNLDTHYRTYLKFTESGDEFFVEHPVSKIHNIMMGSTWLEHFGELIVTNIKTGDQCVVDFKKSGFMQGPNYKIDGKIINKNTSETVIKLSGAWNSNLKGVWCTNTTDFEDGKEMVLWEMDEVDWSDKTYRLTDFALSLNYRPKEMKKLILPTDSRRRLDVRYLLKGEDKRATAWKQVAENQQREEEKEFKSRVGEGEDFWSPVWFTCKKDHQDVDFWFLTGQFWEEREKRAKLLASGQEVELYYGGSVKDTAADFTCYRAKYTDTIDDYLGEIRQKDKERENTKEMREKEKEALEKELLAQEAEEEKPVGKTKKGKKMVTS